MTHYTFMTSCFIDNCGCFYLDFFQLHVVVDYVVRLLYQDISNKADQACVVLFEALLSVVAL